MTQNEDEKYEKIRRELSTAIVDLGYTPEELVAPLAEFLVLVTIMLGATKPEIMSAFEELVDDLVAQEVTIREEIRAAMENAKEPSL